MHIKMGRKKTLFFFTMMRDQVLLTVKLYDFVDVPCLSSPNREKKAGERFVALMFLLSSTVL